MGSKKHPVSARKSWRKLLNLIPGDVGRPVTDIKMQLEVPRLDQVITEVIDTLQAKDLEVQDNAGHWWSVRVRPYKTTENKIEGAVIAFVDIEFLKNPAELERAQGK